MSRQITKMRHLFDTEVIPAKRNAAAYKLRQLLMRSSTPVLKEIEELEIPALHHEVSYWRQQTDIHVKYLTKWFDRRAAIRSYLDGVESCLRAADEGEPRTEFEGRVRALHECLRILNVSGGSLGSPEAPQGPMHSK